MRTIPHHPGTLVQAFPFTRLAPVLALALAWGWSGASAAQVACDPEGTDPCVEFTASDRDEVEYLPTTDEEPEPITLAPDLNCDSTTCTVTDVAAEAGSVSINPDGSLSYIRLYQVNDDGSFVYYSGQDTVTYTLSDGTTREISLFVCAAEPCDFANAATDPPQAGSYEIIVDETTDPPTRTFRYTPNLDQMGAAATLSYEVTDATGTTTQVSFPVTNPGFSSSDDVVAVSSNADLATTLDVTRVGNPDSNPDRYGAAWFSGDDGRHGGAGANLNVANTGDITPAAGQAGLVARSLGGDGGGGENGGTRTFILIRLYGAGGDGGWGGTGGNVEVINNGDITTVGAAGIVAESLGGEGGDGGNGSGFVSSGGAGGAGGRSGNVTVQNFGDVTTSGADADAIRAQSLTGTGGNGGNAGGVFSDGGNAGFGVDAGDVSVESRADLATAGDRSRGVFAHSIGGGGGNGGSSYGLVGDGRDGGGAGDAGTVTVVTDGAINTDGTAAEGIYAYSLGGGGGSGGTAGGWFAFGGDGTAAGDGALVSVTTEGGSITTLGAESSGILALSQGGGGGRGGGAVAAGAWVSVAVGGNGGDGGDGDEVNVGNVATIDTTGEKSHGIYARSLGGGGGDGGFSIAASVGSGGSVSLAVGGSGAGGGVGKRVDVINSGDIETRGEKAHGILALSEGGGGGDGGFAIAAAISDGLAVSLGVGGSGGAGGDAGDVMVDNVGAITTGNAQSHGIHAKSLGGGGGDGGFSITGAIGAAASISAAIGGSGDAGGDAGVVIVGNRGAIDTDGRLAHGIYAKSEGGGGGDGGFAISGAVGAGGSFAFGLGGSGDGGGDGKDVTVTNEGSVDTLGDGAKGIFAKSLGGGGGDGGFSIAASVGASYGALSLSIGGSGGSGGDAGNVSVTNSGSIMTGGTGAIDDSGISTEAHAIHAESIGGGGGDGGFSVAAAFGASEFLVSSAAVSVGGSGDEGGDAGAVTVVNSGDLETSGADAGGIVAVSEGGGGGRGGFSVAGSLGSSGAISFGIGGSGDTGGDGGAVSVTHAGAVTTAGTDATGIRAASLGGGGGRGGFSVAGNLSSQGGVNFSLGGSGGAGGSSSTVDVYNLSGRIETTGNGAHGIAAMSRGGGGGDGGFSVTGALSSGGPGIGLSIGGSADSGGDGEQVTVESAGDIVTHGEKAYGIVAESLGGGGGSGGFSVAGGLTSDGGLNLSIGGSGKGGGIARQVTVRNLGTITTWGVGSSAIRAVSTGGGGGDGGFSIAGSIAFKGGGTNLNAAIGGSGGTGNTGGDITVLSHGLLATFGNEAHGVHARSVGGGGGDGGLSVAGGFGISAKQQWNTNVGVAVGGSGGTGGTGGDVHVGLATDRVTGQIVTDGDDARGIMAQSIGGGGGNGGSSYVINIDWDIKEANNTFSTSIAVGGGAGAGNEGGDVGVFNAASIATGGDQADGIFAQSVGGGGGLGGKASAFTLSTASLVPFGDLLAGDGFSINVAVGGGGGDADIGGDVEVDSTGDIVTTGIRARGIFAQSVGGGGGTGGGGVLAGPCDILADVSGVECPPLVNDAFEVLDAINVVKGFTDTLLKDWSFAVGGNGGDNGDAGVVTVGNTGSIATDGLEAHAILAQSVGGGGGLAQVYIKGINCAEGVEDCEGEGGSAASGLTGKLGLGGAGGSGGDGGNVTVTNTGRLETTGVGAYGIYAQSVGGGGGAAGSVDNGFGLETLGLDVPFGLGLGYAREGGGRGDGGVVTVIGGGDISTAGDGAIGIFAQSVGGGGGVAGDVGFGFAGTVGGQGSGGAVTVTQRADVVTRGAGAHAIFAQSAGGETGTEDPNAGGVVEVTVDGGIRAFGAGASGIVAQSFGTVGADSIRVRIEGGVVQGGSGESAGVVILDGADNLLTNAGTILSVAGIDGMAIRATLGDDSIANSGLVIGSIDLGAGSNAFRNAAGARLESGAGIDLGLGNALTNAGTLAIGGTDRVMTTVLTGDLVTSVASVLEFDVDMGGDAADRLHVTGSASLDGLLRLTLDAPAVARIRDYTLLTAAGGLTDAGVALELMNLPPALQAWLAGAGPAGIGIHIEPDFTLGGADLSANRHAVAAHLNDIVRAGPQDGMQQLLDAVVVLDTAEQVEGALQRLHPEPLLALAPTTLLSALRFNDALHSCRVREGEYRFNTEGSCRWASLTGRWFDQDATTARLGFERTALEIAVGAQGEIDTGLHTGLAFGYERSEYDVDNLAELDGEQFELGAVLKGQVAATSFAGSLSVGYGRYDTIRHVDVLASDAVHRGSQDLVSITAGLRFSHDISRGNWYLRPLVDLVLSRMEFSGWTEEGNDAGALRVASHTEFYATVQPALELGGEFAMATGTLVRPFLRLGTTHLLSDPETGASVTFQGTPAGVAPFATVHRFEDDYFDFAVGLDVLRVGGMTFRVGYFGQAAEGASEQNASAKLTFAF